MKKIIIGILLLVLAIILLSKNTTHREDTHIDKKESETTETTESLKDFSMFPEGTDELVQTVIHLESQENESQDYKVEIYAEKTEMIDCNTRSLVGEFKEINLEGWGYTYYEFESNDFVIATLMACPEGSEREGTVQSQSFITRYNSKLPLVVYASPEYTIKYRIWSPEIKTTEM